MERIKHGNVLMTIDDENKQEALELAKRFANIGYGIYATRVRQTYLKLKDCMFMVLVRLKQKMVKTF